MPEEEGRKHWTDCVGDAAQRHVHLFVSNTSLADGHLHSLLGTTGPAQREGSSHVHCLKALTSFVSENGEGHWHLVDLLTGPAIELAAGRHTHYWSGTTSREDGHTHLVADIVALEPPVRG